MLRIIGGEYPLDPCDIGEFSILSAKGMKFSVRAYEARGLGRVSVMRAKGFFGALRMDTLIITPKKTDLPLFSYDRIYALGNESLYLELYDTMVSPAELSRLEKLKRECSELAEKDAGTHWYDEIRLGESTVKTGKKKDEAKMDAFSEEYLKEYLRSPCDSAPDETAKREKTAVYVEGLLKFGGPSTDVFKKALGEEKTNRLFRDVLFGIN